MEPPVVRKGTKNRVGEMGVGGEIATFFWGGYVNIIFEGEGRLGLRGGASGRMVCSLGL
jgi:hypothetical protein